MSTYNPLLLLQNMPTLEEIITTWKKETESEMHYKYWKFDKPQYKEIVSTKDDMPCFIYSITNREFKRNFYIRIKNGDLYRIPSIEQDIDAMTIAEAYVWSAIGKQFASYQNNSKILNFDYFNIFTPILICKALCLCDPSYLLKNDVYQQKEAVFSGIEREVIYQLRRILGEKSIKEKES
jgi:hypothetical protein